MFLNSFVDSVFESDENWRLYSRLFVNNRSSDSKGLLFPSISCLAVRYKIHKTYTLLTTLFYSQSIRKNGQFRSNSKAYKSCGNGCAQNYKKRTWWRTFVLYYFFFPTRVSIVQRSLSKGMSSLSTAFVPLKALAQNSCIIACIPHLGLANTVRFSTVSLKIP